MIPVMHGQRITIALAISLLFSGMAGAQQMQMNDFVLFGGNGTSPGCTYPSSPGPGVQMGSSSSVTGGSIGSYKLVKSTGTVSITGNIHSGGTVILANSNSVTGKISAANAGGATGNILSVGSNASLGGNIDVNGNVSVGGGTVSGSVTHPGGTTYSGPLPAGGNILAPPALPALPALPAITPFPAYGNTSITSTQSITPGNYKDLKLSGNKTLTFNGPGVYVFKSIKNSGSTNNKNNK